MAKTEKTINTNNTKTANKTLTGEQNINKKEHVNKIKKPPNEHNIGSENINQQMHNKPCV